MNIKSLIRFVRSVLVFSLSLMGFKSLAETFSTDSTKITESCTEEMNNESNISSPGQRTLIKSTVLSSGNWSSEKSKTESLNPGDVSTAEVQKILANGNWTSAKKHTLSAGNWMTDLIEVKESGQWSKVELEDLLSSGNWTVQRVELEE